MSSNSENPNKTPLAVGLSIVGGVGFSLMIFAIAVGVIQGENAATNVIGLLFFSGLVLLVFGTGGWYGVVQPHKHFDDINQPQYTGHHDEH